MEKTAVPVDVRAARITLSHVLNMLEGMFRARGTLRESAYEKALDSAKKVLRKVQAEPQAKLYLGEHQVIWNELMTCFREALPVIEKLSCVPLESTGTGHDNSNAALMVANQTELMGNLEKLGDLMAIARTTVASTRKAQNLSAQEKFDQQALKVVELCVRVTSRCYDGDASPRIENQWTSIIASFKKLLLTSLQFLHNMIQLNEHRKLLLWLDLFGNSKHSDPDFSTAELSRTSPIPPETSGKATTLEPSATKDLDDGLSTTGLPLPSDEALRTAMEKLGHGAGPSQILDSGKKQILLTGVKSNVAFMCDRASADQPSMAQVSLHPVNPSGTDTKPIGKWDWAKIPLKDYSSEGIEESDTMITRNPDAAAQSLKEAKEQLMARLPSKGDDPTRDDLAFRSYISATSPPVASDQHGTNGSDGAPNGSGEEDEGQAKGEGGPTNHSIEDQERGILTNIPLVLGPDEIDVLPMMIKSCICPTMDPPADANEAMEMKHMQAVRCNILLAQDAGRNLLRELLIFIAAWELGDDDFYFKLMQQIMDAILNNGLMPFAYQSFGEVKDIVSPAQSIVIKIITQSFRKKQYTLPPAGYKVPHGTPPVAPTRADLLVVRYVFTVFRQSIIPETCALIYLQGQIRLGAAYPEDFPLNLWDMERVYEGVYQFLEFFAVLTENEMWKEMLVKWEIVSELVTLLRELDASIPKAPLTPAETAREEAEAAGLPVPAEGSTSASAQVERPYDPVATDETAPASYEADPAPDSPSHDPDNPEPVDFEWRNLKKLVVLVLSSLVWKSIAVQNQIRQYGGVEMVLNCCNYDNNNPYIREHAIMCLRFLLENSPKNQAIVGQLEARKVVPSEVLDSKGYETFIDRDGKVGLRPKDPEADVWRMTSKEV